MWAERGLGAEAPAAAATPTTEPPRSRDKQRAARKRERVCFTCGRDDGDECLLLCDGHRCDVAQHTFCCHPPLATVPSGKWFCTACTIRRLSSREQLALAMNASLAEMPAPAQSCRRTPLEQRPTTHASDPPVKSVGRDGVTTLQLAEQSPWLDFDHYAKQGTIFDHEGTRLAGCVRDADGRVLGGTELNGHPDPRTLSRDGSALPARILTEQKCCVRVERATAPPPRVVIDLSLCSPTCPYAFDFAHGQCRGRLVCTAATAAWS